MGEKTLTTYMNNIVFETTGFSEKLCLNISLTKNAKYSKTFSQHRNDSLIKTRFKIIASFQS